MFDVSRFCNGTLHWWLHLEPSNTVRVLQPRDPSAKHYDSARDAWNDYVRYKSTDPPMAVLEPLISHDPQDRAVAMLDPIGGFLIGFDVWWRDKTSPSKGYLPLPSPEAFYDLVQTRVPDAYRTFYQIIIPDRACAFYFDVDVDDSPAFDMVYFLHALFEEMAAELGRTADEFWLGTLLLDASRGPKGSCHGICHVLTFADNHTVMKAFARRIFERLERRPDSKRLRVWRAKKEDWVIPFDCSVYSHYRNFRFLENAKMTPNKGNQRHLVVASYNRFTNTPTDARELFLLSVIPQPAASAVHLATVAPPHISVVRPVKRARQDTVSKAESRTSTGLADFLLTQLRQWGNTNAALGRIEPARGTTWAPGTLYVSFACATHAHDHKHASNNLYAIVELRALRVHWFCHSGSTRCPMHRQPLPIPVAMTIKENK